MSNEKKSYGPVNKIVTKGVCVEFTRKPSEAKEAYRDAAAPKEWWVLNEDGSARLEERTV